MEKSYRGIEQDSIRLCILVFLPIMIVISVSIGLTDAAVGTILKCEM